jgi:hypothetical protein
MGASHPVWEVVELGQEWLNRLRVVGAVGKRLHERKRRIDEDARIGHCDV